MTDDLIPAESQPKETGYCHVQLTPELKQKVAENQFMRIVLLDNGRSVRLYFYPTREAMSTYVR